MPLDCSNAHIRAMAPHDWPIYRDLRLRSLSDAPDAFCSTFASEQWRSPQNWAERLQAASVSGRDQPLVAELDGVPVGLAWAKVDGEDAGVVNIFQVWVAPEARGRGVAAELIRTCVAWARARGAQAVQLSVTVDAPAARLYAREGFRNVGAPLPRKPGEALMEQAMRLALY
ncbi:MAG: N-acetyltransferase family protein [Gammaproteobacteria bacterium]